MATKRLHKQPTDFFAPFVFGFWICWSIGVYIMLAYEKGFLLRLFDARRTWEETQVFQFFSASGEEFTYALFTIVLIFINWRKAFLVPILGVAVTILSYILKRIFNEPRPFENYFRSGMEECISIVDWIVPHHGLSSFPSGHTMSAFALFSFLAFFVKKPIWQVLCLFMAIMIGLSRIYLYNHYLQDVLSGSLIGLLLGYIFYQISTKIK